MNARTKLIGTIVLGAALLVPVAQAQSPDDRAGLRGPGAFETTQPSASHPDNRAVRGPGSVETQLQLQQTSVAIRPDDRAGTRGPGSIGTPDFSSAANHPDNRAETRGPGATTVVVASTSNGFDWGDALIGGLGGVGTALLLTGCLFLLMGQRNRTRIA